MKLLPLLTATSLGLFLAPSAPAKQASRPVTAPSSIAPAQAKFCEQWTATQRSDYKGVDRRSAVMAEVRNSPRKSTVREALQEFHPGGKATLSGVRDDQIVFISTTLEKGESAAILKSPRESSYTCPNTYTLIKSVSNGKGHPFMQQYQVMYLP